MVFVATTLGFLHILGTGAVLWHEFKGVGSHCLDFELNSFICFTMMISSTPSGFLFLILFRFSLSSDKVKSSWRIFAYFSSLMSFYLFIWILDLSFRGKCVVTWLAVTFLSFTRVTSFPFSMLFCYFFIISVLSMSSCYLPFLFLHR